MLMSFESDASLNLRRCMKLCCANQKLHIEKDVQQHRDMIVFDEGKE